MPHTLRQAAKSGPGLSIFWPGLSSGRARQAPISPSMRWKTDWINDWNKWSNAERVLALLVASLLLALIPLSSLLLASQ